MGCSKEMFFRMREEEFNALPPEQRKGFRYFEFSDDKFDEVDKSDPVYVKLHNAFLKAENDLQEYLKKRDKLPLE